MDIIANPAIPREAVPLLPQLVKLSSSSKPKLIIPSDVENKIRQLCNRIHDVEWSGTLFYKYKGGWDNLVIECVDIYLMDIGSVTYTEFDVEPGVIAYMCDHIELMDCQMGLVHSHNNMSTFFSGTDTSTLREEGNKRNHFVSLIVNNAGSYTAGITRRVDIERTTIDYGTFHSFEDSTENLGNSERTVILSEIQWIEFDIEKATIANDCTELEQRIAEIKQRKAAKPIKIVETSPIALPKKKPQEQLKLFDDELDLPYRVQDINNMSEDEELDKIIHSYFLQLVTGAVTISDESKLDINKWAASMDKLFDKRFKTMKEYKAWAEGFCEFLVMYPVAKYEEVDEFTYAEYIANGIMEKLERLKENKYINTLIKVLTQWTIE